MKAKCNGLRYEKGDAILEQGFKSHQRSKNIGGLRFRNKGHGWGIAFIQSKLILELEIGGVLYETWIDHFFKKNLGRLTASNRQLIEETMPEEIRVKKKKGQKSTYYVPLKVEFDSWLERATRAKESKSVAPVASS